jgi:hypothetical protein
VSGLTAEKDGGCGNIQNMLGLSILDRNRNVKNALWTKAKSCRLDLPHGVTRLVLLAAQQFQNVAETSLEVAPAVLIQSQQSQRLGQQCTPLESNDAADPGSSSLPSHCHPPPHSPTLDTPQSKHQGEPQPEG